MLVKTDKDIDFLGEDALVSDLLQIFQNEDTFLINVYGEVGSGKSKLFKQLLDSGFGDIPFSFIDDGFFGEDFFQTHDEHVFLIDNVDHYYSKEQFKDLMMKFYSQHSKTRILFTSKNKFFLEALPAINNFNFEIGNRVFGFSEFQRFLQSKEIMEIVNEVQLPTFIVKNTFLFTTYCRNFNFVHEVLHSVVNHLKSQKSITPKQFIEILTQSELFTKLKQELVIDTKNLEGSDYLFFMRAKDKIEKLRDLIIKYYPDEYVFLEVMKNQFSFSFVENAFNKMNIPYADKVLNICLTYDPIELLVNLLGPRDIILELNQKNIGEASFTYSIEDKAKLILKSIGMNILDKPKGLDFFLDRFKSNYKLLLDDTTNKMNKEYMIGLGISCYQELEHVFYEMINFYSTFFFGSMSSFLAMYNEQNGTTRIYEKRITFGQYISLFSYLNQIGKRDNNQLKMMNLNLRTILPSKIIRKTEEISSLRSFFSHFQKVQNFEIPYKTYRSRITKLYSLAIDLMESLKEISVFPEIIKIKEVIFDEFGRKLFVATDWRNSEIRFSLSNSLNNIDIYSHYYILRKNQMFMINPILIPRYIEGNQEKFSGEKYDQSSHTQLKQGAELIGQIDIEDDIHVLDVGCGNGRTTIDLYQKNTSITIDAFDFSESMIETAVKNRVDHGIPENQIHFYVMDAMELDSENKYDLVFSNATLHWMVDSKSMYQKLYNSLVNGGKLAVHQGGYECYKGLHEKVKKAIDALDLHMYYRNWQYPVYYPTKEEYSDMLMTIGFTNVHVKSVETDGREYSNLVENFANAGMLPYLSCLPEENLRKKLKQEYIKICKSEPVDQYTHRLYAFATKGE